MALRAWWLAVRLACLFGCWTCCHFNSWLVVPAWCPLAMLAGWICRHFGGGARLVPSCCVCSLACLLSWRRCCYFGSWLVVPAWCPLAMLPWCSGLLPFWGDGRRCAPGSHIAVLAWRLGLPPLRLVGGGARLLPTPCVCLVARFAALPTRGRWCPPGTSLRGLLGLLAWWLEVPPLRLVGGGADPGPRLPRGPHCACFALLAWWLAVRLACFFGGWICCHFNS